MDILFDERVISYAAGGCDRRLEDITNNVAFMLAEQHKTYRPDIPQDDNGFYYKARDMVINYLTNCQNFGVFERFIMRQAIEYEKKYPDRNYAAICFAQWVGAFHILKNAVCLNGDFINEAERMVNSTFRFS